MKIKLFALLCLVLISNISFGQFLSNLSTLNPAMTGLEDKHFGQVIYSRPNIQGFNKITGLYNYSADNINSGFGILVSQDQHPWINSSQFGGSYQYTFNFSKNAKLSVGTSLRYSSLNTRGANEELFGWKKRESLMLNFGAAFDWKKLNVGVSSRNINLISNNNTNINSESNLKKGVFYYLSLHAWYNFEIGNNFILSPSIVTRGNSSFNFINVRGEHFNRFWWIAGYSPEDYVSIGAGVRVFDQLHVGYNLEFNVKLNSSNYHRFSLSYRLKK